MKINRLLVTLALLTLLALPHAAAFSDGFTETFETGQTDATTPVSSEYTCFITGSNPRFWAFHYAGNGVMGGDWSLLVSHGGSASDALATFLATGNDTAPDSVSWYQTAGASSGGTDRSGFQLADADLNHVFAIHTVSTSAGSTVRLNSTTGDIVATPGGGFHHHVVNISWSEQTYDYSLDDTLLVSDVPFLAGVDMTYIDRFEITSAMYEYSYQYDYIMFGTDTEVGGEGEGEGGGGGGEVFGPFDFPGLTAEEGGWFMGILIVGVFLALFARISTHPVSIGIAVLLGIGTSVVVGYMPVWVLVLLFLAVGALVATMFRGGGGGE